MNVIDSQLIIEKNLLANTGAFIPLVKVYFTATATTLRFTSNTQSVKWGGNTYTAIPLTLEDIPENNSGEIPSLSLNVSNAERSVLSYVEDLNAVVKGTVTLYFVHTNNLDITDAFLDFDFAIENISVSSKWITFNLTGKNYWSYAFPAKTFRKNLCNWNFVTDGSAQCRYVINPPIEDIIDVLYAETPEINDSVIGATSGATADVGSIVSSDGPSGSSNSWWTIGLKNVSGTFILGENVQIDAITDVKIRGLNSCDYTLASCRRRQNSERFGAFPGIARGSIKLI